MIQIDMPMPDNCDECRFNTEYGFCKAMPDNFCGNTDDRKRPEWCPMKEQDAIEPKWFIDAHNPAGAFKCSACGERIVEKDIDFYCSKCGKPILWEGR